MKVVAFIYIVNGDAFKALQGASMCLAAFPKSLNTTELQVKVHTQINKLLIKEVLRLVF